MLHHGGLRELTRRDVQRTLDLLVERGGIPDGDHIL